MSIFRKEKREFSYGRGEWGNTTPPSNGMLGSPAAGVSVTEQSALGLAAVYGATGVIADSFSTLPVQVWDKDDPKTRKETPLPPLLECPYAEISQLDWLVQFATSLALRGNFYGEIVEFDNELYPVQIKPIHPDNVTVRRETNGQIVYRYFGKIVPRQRVFHVRYISTPGSLTGVNPIESLRNSFGLARAQDLYGGAFYANSALPLGAIEVPDELDEDEVRALAERWKSLHQGINSSNLPAVLTGGAKFNPITVSNKDLQFLEARGFSQMEIVGMIFRVPPHMCGIVDRTTSWGKGIEQQEIGFVRNTLLPYIRRYEESMTALIPSGVVRMDISHRLKASVLERYEAYNYARMGGWMSANDIRDREDEPPIPNGNEYLVSSGAELLKAKVEEAKRAKEKPNEPPQVVMHPGFPGAPSPVAPTPEGDQGK